MAVMSSFFYIGNCISEDRGSQEDRELAESDAMKTFGVMNKLCNARCVSFVKKNYMQEWLLQQ